MLLTYFSYDNVVLSKLLAVIFSPAECSIMIMSKFSIQRDKEAL
jgi:hypothetical protein